MIFGSETVARGWSRVVGELGGVNKDVEPTALGNPKVRSEGDSRESRTLSRHSRRSGRVLLSRCPGSQGRAAWPPFFVLSCPLVQGPWPRSICFSHGRLPIHLCSNPQVSDSLAFQGRECCLCVCVCVCVCVRERERQTDRQTERSRVCCPRHLPFLLPGTPPPCPQPDPLCMADSPSFRFQFECQLRKAFTDPSLLYHC